MNVEQPLVTFVIAARNAAMTLDATLRALTLQKDGRWTAIVVDDCSVDGTSDVVASVADSRITLLRNGRQMGRGASRSRAIDLVETRWIAVQDADDISLPARLERSLQIADENPDAVMVTGEFIHLVEDRLVASGPFTGEVVDLTSAMRGGRGPVRHAAALVRTDALRGVGGYPAHLLRAQDVFMMVRVAHVGAVYHTREPLILYRRGRFTGPRYQYQAVRWAYRSLSELHAHFGPQLRAARYRAHPLVRAVRYPGLLTREWAARALDVTTLEAFGLDAEFASHIDDARLLGIFARVR